MTPAGRRPRASAERVSALVVLLLLAVGRAAASEAGDAVATPTSEVEQPSDESLRGWIADMKRAPRGPFQDVRWFCRDGEVLPPRAYACVEHGGGVQHGRLGARAMKLRELGVPIAVVLASLEPTRFVGPQADLASLRFLVLERFLIGWDDGWIFRQVRSVRGALQAEDEEAAAETLLRTLLDDPLWREPARFFLLRELVRLLPYADRPDLAGRVRALSAQLSELDPDFGPLRARIHATPEAADARRVRDYARRHPEPPRPEFEELAAAIDELFRPRAATTELEGLLRRVREPLRSVLRAELGALGARDPAERVAAAARALVLVRREVAAGLESRSALAALRASLVLERVAFTSAQVRLEAPEATRRARLDLIGALARVLHGTGLLGTRSLETLEASLGRLAVEQVTLGALREELSLLGRAAEWSRRWTVYTLGPAIDRLAVLEPLALQYAPDRLRGSPLLPYTRALDGLVRDAQRLAGIEDRVLGESVGAGIRALNPGLARGVLREAPTAGIAAALPRDAIAILPETIAELPPVAGILTLGEGSSLSHVQLLARNLGIPNAVVDDAVAVRLRAAVGEAVEVAVSPGGVVHVERVAPDEAAAPPAEPPSEFSIEIDRDRLDLARRGLMALDSLRAADSGRVCGPKAANLGELRAHFGELVPDGFVIPFGAFRALLDESIEPGGPAAFDWIAARYDEIEALPEAERETAVRALLARMRDWITSRDPGEAFREKLARRLAELGSTGVFVRSDTNVEDLPGFTGAGLNLTVPNVVGPDRVLDAILRVWASPFSERAYAWRQAHMRDPEWVLPSVLVQAAFAAHRSGVLVTADLATGDPDVLSVAVGEGVGGAVDGQAVESIAIDRATGAVRFLAPASSPLRAELDPRGGIRRVPASGAESLLGPAEIDALRSLADRVADFPALEGPSGQRFPADLEFAFRDGRLALLQLRPFVRSRRAEESERLRALDAPLRERADRIVRLDEGPGGDGT
ncbi:MAG: PEP/pyruvate-binding domain-containing protein [Myxococcota bacterium]